MPLVYRDRGSSNTQLDVLCGTVIVTRIGKDWSTVMNEDAERWSWHMKQESGPKGYQVSGSASSLAEAKSFVDRMWGMWL